MSRKKIYVPLIAALTVMFTVAMIGVAWADQVVNNLDASIDGAAETATTTQGVPTTVGFFIQPSNTVPADDANGCNATGSAPATLTITAPSGVTPTTTTLTMVGCGDTNAEDATFTAAAAGTYSFTSSAFSLTGGKAGSLWETSTAQFTLQVNSAPASDTTPPVVTITFPSPNGVNGWFTSATVNGSVSATDASNVIAIDCTDTASGLTQGVLVGGGTGTASRTLAVTGEGTHSISCSATDGASTPNTGAATGSTAMPVEIEIDSVAPTVTVTPARAADHNGWYNAPVSFNTSGTDATSGVSDENCTLDQNYTGPDGTGNTVSGSCTDNAGNVGNGTSTAFNFDDTNPTVSLVTPPNGADYLQNQVVNASYTCADLPSPPQSGLDTCLGTVVNSSAIDTSTFGSHALTVTATDLAGNTLVVTHTYTVTYGFDGFYQPVDNLPASNKAKAGQTIPFKWNLLDSAGNKIENNVGLFTVGWGAKFACSAAGADTIETYDTSGASGLRWDDVAKQYVFTAQSVKADATYCRYLIVRVGSNGVKQALVSFTR